MTVRRVNVGGSQGAGKRDRPRSFWLRHLMEFFKTTALHGYKYIAMEGAPAWERFCWCVAVLVCLMAAVSLVLVAWQWNDSNPTITVIESTHHAIWRIPFPAVTVCSLNKVSLSRAVALSRALKLPPEWRAEDALGHMRHAALALANAPISRNASDGLAKLQQLLDLNNLTVQDFMLKVLPSCDTMLERCSWKGGVVRCSSFFYRSVSIDGFCCSFNYYAQKQSPHKSVKNPRRIAACGYQTALSVLIKTLPEDYYSATYGTYGARVYVHYSYDFPDENASAKLVGPNTETFFEISPENTYATDTIRSMEVAKRRCTFPAEATTLAFAKYTYSNCLAECRSRIVLAACGCVPYFLPNNGSVKTCTFADAGCVYNNRQQYGSSLPQGNFSCGCTPDCEHFSYPMEMASGKLTKVGAHNSLVFFKDVTVTNQSLLHIYFSDLVGIRYRTDVFMNWHNLLGLLGLFSGFSLVSGFEMLYFFTVRFFFDLAHGKADVKGTDDHLTEKWAEKHGVIQVKPTTQVGRF